MPTSAPDQAALLHWVERVALYLARDGVSPIAGRILGWLMICEPPEQSAAQIATAIGASRASLSTMMPLLLTMGLVARRGKPGARTVYYRVEDQAWQRLVERQIATLITFGQITSAGLELVGAGSERAARIRDAHHTFVWLREVFAGAPPMPSRARANRPDRSAETAGDWDARPMNTTDTDA